MGVDVLKENSSLEPVSIDIRFLDLEPKEKDLRETSSSSVYLMTMHESNDSVKNVIEIGTQSQRQLTFQ